MLQRFLEDHPEHAEELNSYLQPIQIASGEMILDDAEHSQNIFFIVSGTVKMQRKNSFGKYQDLMSLECEQAINLEVLSALSSVGNRYIAETAVSLLRIQIDLLKRFPALLNTVMANCIVKSYDQCLFSQALAQKRQRYLWGVVVLVVLVTILELVFYRSMIGIFL